MFVLYMVQEFLLKHSVFKTKKPRFSSELKYLFGGDRGGLTSHHQYFLRGFFPRVFSRSVERIPVDRDSCLPFQASNEFTLDVPFVVEAARENIP